MEGCCVAASLYLWQLLVNLSIAFGIAVASWSARTCLFALDHASPSPATVMPARLKIK